MIFLRKYRLEATLLLIFIFLLVGSWYSEFSQAADEIQREVLRFHILAASDSEEDQRLKLAVRDRLLEEKERWLPAENTQKSMEVQLQRQLKEIALVVEDELRRNHSDAMVTVQLCHSDFSTRVFNELLLPAGEYDALRIIIGDGKGRNWWCVLFPSLCLSSAGTEEWLEAHDLEVLQNSPHLEARLALYEWLQRLKNS